MKNCTPMELGNILATPSPLCACPSLPVCIDRPRVYSPAVLSGPPSCRPFAVCFAMWFRETPRTDDAASDTTSLPPLFLFTSFLLYYQGSLFLSLLSSPLPQFSLYSAHGSQSAVGLLYCRLMHVLRGVGRLFLSNICPEGKEGCAGVLERQGLKM
jgi:hypothetical protein